MAARSSLPRRFYGACDVAELPEGFALRLDGKVARSPGGGALIAPTPALAELMCTEWAAQGDVIRYFDMPATRLMHTVLDALGPRRAETAASVAGFAAADLICYFAEGPRTLVERQTATWRPLLDWARDALGLTFRETTGIRHAEQPAATLAAVEALAADEDDFTLAALALAAAIFGSAILALAMKTGRLDGREALAAARLDESFQEERWGLDAESARNTATLEAECEMLERWFAALR
jgi:chaperone required for assembly of F1-ATPase